MYVFEKSGLVEENNEEKENIKIWKDISYIFLWFLNCTSLKNLTEKCQPYLAV